MAFPLGDELNSFFLETGNSSSRCTYFCSSAFLNFSALSSTRSWSALILAAVSSTGCLMRSEADGRLVGSGWIISWKKTKQNTIGKENYTAVFTKKNYNNVQQLNKNVCIICCSKKKEKEYHHENRAELLARKSRAKAPEEKQRVQDLRHKYGSFRLRERQTLSKQQEGSVL